MFSDGAAKYGLYGGVGSTTPTELNTIVTPSEGGDPDKLLGLANPLTALLVIAAVTFGLAGFATTVRVGNSSAALNLGKS